MEPSPLTQDARPERFQPKILRLYEALFTPDDGDDSGVALPTGFWQEFFLHRPDPAGLRRILAAVAPDEMLHQQARSQQLFRQATIRIQQARAPADATALEVRRRRPPAEQLCRLTRPDFDRLPRHGPGKALHQPQRRQHRSAGWPARCRHRHDRLRRNARYRHPRWAQPYARASRRTLSMR